MSDTTTELEVLDQIVDVLGGQSGQYETVVPTLQQILALLGGGGGGSDSGYNPSLSVGRADALTGADSTAQWSQRVTEGGGSATVRSVQGAAVAWNQLVGSDTSSVTVPSGHKYLGIIGGAASIATSDGAAMSVTGGTDQLFDLTTMFGAGNEPSTVAEFERMYPEAYYPYSAPTLKPVQIAGIQSKDAQGGELDSVEWTAQELWSAGTAGDMLYADHKETKVGVVDLGALTWTYYTEAGTNPVFSGNILTMKNGVANAPSNLKCLLYDTITSRGRSNFANNAANMQIAAHSDNVNVMVRNDSYNTVEDFKAAMSGVLLYYELKTPTTIPISPALPMTYRVEQGGSESIIVPAGEISAIPVLTIAEGESAADVVMDALACIAAPDGPTATANHSVGTYLTMGGKLYKVTSAIAVGETITPNTNVTETTVMAELIARTA